jgi:hypothetical protein
MFAMNFDLDAYALKRRLTGETTGETYLYFRPGFMAGVAVAHWGTHTDAAGKELIGNLLMIGGEVGGFSGNGAYGMFTVTIRSGWYVSRH